MIFVVLIQTEYYWLEEVDDEKRGFGYYNDPEQKYVPAFCFAVYVLDYEIYDPYAYDQVIEVQL